MLTRAGYRFDIEPSGVDERCLDDESPDDFVARIALAKATAVAPDDDRLVLGADTIVLIDHEMLGKPRERLEATAVSGGPDDDRLVLGADTIVLIDHEMLGKPRDSDDAISMLRRLSGRTHQVLTGVAVVCGPERRVAVASTQVSLVALDDATIAAYVSTGEPMDKAGGYGVQGIASRFVAQIDGSYTNVVGLPMVVVERLLRALDDGF